MEITRDDLDTIRAIYDAALDPSRWSAVLDGFVERSGAVGAGLFVEDSTTREFQLAAVSSIFTPEILREHYELVHDAETKAYENLLRFPAEQLFTDDEILDGVIDPDSLPGRDLLHRHLGTRYRAAARLHDRGVWFDVAVAQFRDPGEPFSPEHLKRANLFLPHLGKVVELSRAFMVLRSRFHAVITALDRYHLGVLILEPGGQVVIRNREADRILELDDGFSLDPSERPRALRASDHGRLQSAIRAAAETAQGRDRQADVHLTIERRSGEDPFLVEICPISDSGAELERGFGGVFLLVVDPAETRHVSTRGLPELYGLTPAESEVCRLLATGLGTDGIADRREVSVETIRSQVKQILQKTGTTSRSQLVRLALTVNLPIDGSGSDE